MSIEQGLTLRFRVTLDADKDLGFWTKCEGIGVEYEIHEYKEGGQNSFVHRFPGRRKYPTVKLTRPLNSDSARVAKLVSATAEPGIRPTGQITVFDSQGLEVASWTLDQVAVSKWTGPNLDVNGKDTAFETLELIHTGFLS